MKLARPLQQVNCYGVSKSQWKKWPDLAQRVFNETYGTMLEDPGLFAHPAAKKVPTEQWSTTCWNAAWVAADACKRGLKDIIAGVGYAEI